MRGVRPRRGARLNVGVLGGTFDPVHNAHLAIARLALVNLQLDKILFVPTGAPHYRAPAVAAAADRVAMLKLALEGEPSYAIDERELAPQATGYTVDTLKALRAELGPAQLFLLMGGDQYASIEAWDRWPQLFELARIAVFARPGWRAPDTKAIVVPMPALDISATEIRKRISASKDFSQLVPAAVRRYIVEHRLYH